MVGVERSRCVIGVEQVCSRLVAFIKHACGRFEGDVCDVGVGEVCDILCGRFNTGGFKVSVQQMYCKRTGL